MQNNRAIPLVSIVMPAYNVEKYIADAVNSVLNQSYENFELIIVNDGSTDATSEIIESLAQKDKRINVLSQKNQGLGPARNNGFKLCKGDYVYFADSDDILHPDLLKIAVHISRENDLDIVEFKFQKFREDTPPPPRISHYDANDVKATNSSRRKMIMFGSPEACLHFYSMRLLKRSGVRYPAIFHEDEVETRRLFCYADKIMSIPCALYFYRIRPTSIMSKPIGEHWKSYLKVCELLVDVAKEIPDFSHELYYFVYRYLMWTRKKIVTVNEPWISDALAKYDALLAQISDEFEDNPYFIMEEKIQKIRNEYESSHSWKLITKLRKLYHALHLDTLGAQVALLRRLK